jgi:hypothetical protein
MPLSFIDGILAAKRAELDAVERFAQTTNYQLVLNMARSYGLQDPERWLVDWLVRQTFGLGSRPLDIAVGPNGANRLVDCLTRFAGAKASS